MNSKLLLKLTKREILKLPEFDDMSDLKLNELREVLKDMCYDLKLTNPTVKQYKQAYKQYITKINTERENRLRAQLRKVERAERDVEARRADDELFNSIKSMKNEYKQKQKQRNEYKQRIKNEAISEREAVNDLFKTNSIYEDTKSADRKHYEELVTDKKEFQNEMKKMMIDAKNKVGFEVNIGDDGEKQLAFTKVLEYLHKTQKGYVYPVVLSRELGGRERWFTVNNTNNVKAMIGHILGEITVDTEASDTNPMVMDAFQPDSFKIVFINKEKKGKNTSFTGLVRDSETNEVIPEEFELSDDFRAAPEGSFFPYINLSSVDLSCLQIFNSVNKNNYTDCCFVYACIQSGVFTEDEIQKMREVIQTRSLPNRKIKEIAEAFKCHFKVTRIDEERKSRHQHRTTIDTTKLKNAKEYKRMVKLLLYKDHYMLHFDSLPVTIYYLKNMNDLDKRFGDLSQSRRQLITGINSENGEAEFKPFRSCVITVLRTMFELNLFRPINQCESDILSTCEFDSHLNDYVDLEFNEELCCELEDDTPKKITEWSKIYYADFETDTTVNPHDPYLCCVCHKNECGKLIGNKFTGENISGQLLNYLQHNSLTYFHNLKYDACFFINDEEWESSVTQRSGTVLQIIMTKKMTYKKNGKEMTWAKRLTFRNSKSLIPAALVDFASMFKLKVHKEIMAYKIYTKANRQKGFVSVKEFFDQYCEENKDLKSAEELAKDQEQIKRNAELAKALKGDELDLMKYAYFYCMKDCVVLMEGMDKFNNDLNEVFKETKKEFLGIHQFISISALGYDFARIYGCFNGCYKLSGKPQNFIQRCVNGGRTMTANNQKQYVEGRIQDFDAVSLYPSAMSIMDGVPKGIPKIVPNGISEDELMAYDTFFVEVNITELKPKSTVPYAFGQVFKLSNAGSKLFGNEPVNNYLLDKIALLDLIEFYEIKYEVIRGLYFNEGFNKRINQFVTKLFNLRLKYKKMKNPLEKTIKLLLNSIYGKSILKPMVDEVKLVKRDKLTSYIYRNYNFIKEVTIENGISKAYVKKIKPINKHFNLPQFGASVLSWSKHIMNSVVSTAEQNDIAIYYTDTDSIHMKESDIDKLSKMYKEKYGKDLIGSNMTQFHCDFDSFSGAVGEIHSRKLIALGKKSYLDILVDEKGNEDYHVRMKGVPKQCIINKAKRMGITIEKLYERMYEGEKIEFDLKDGMNCFKKTKTFQQITLPQFIRKVKF
ncbi:hypothetical protein M9Y10_001224 [Tritrichomonas musculus]|uniref:DNA-directed DNA polymerase n=1 Tax=Tritrichomonas musculus TaxID=1915356 RepID=A0ABR2L6S2_9EUKA